MDPKRKQDIQMASAAAQKVLRDMASRVPGKMKKDFGAWGRYSLRRFIVARLSGGQGLRRRTGALSKSFRVKTTTGTTLNDVKTTFSTTSKYAPPLEFGKRGIKSTRPKGWLAIPIWKSIVLTPAGVYRPEPGPLKITLPAYFGPSFTFFVAESKKGNVILFGKQPMGTKGKFKLFPMFVLKEKVDLPPRLKFYRTITLYFKVLKSRMDDSMGRVFNG